MYHVRNAAFHPSVVPGLEGLCSNDTVQTVAFRFEDLDQMRDTLSQAGLDMALVMDASAQANVGEWVLAVFEVATGKRATAAAGRVVRAGRGPSIEFEQRDWDRLVEFATPWQPSSEATTETTRVPDSVTHGARALVVEDERVSREMVTTFLLGLGLVARPTATAERALELLDRENFDLAVLDLALPGMDGLELCGAIRRRTDRARSLPILILTADSSEMSSKRSFHAGADDFITKPVPVLEFRARILALLQRKRDR
jgi:CheY-like chemotaxis protein